MTSGNVILNIKDLNVNYFTLEGVVKAVRGLSFTLRKGESLCIVGESGSGKSTVGLTIIRALPSNAVITSGEVVFNDVDLLSLSEEEMSNKIRGKEISMIFQDPAATFNPLFTIGQTLSDVVRHHLGIKEKDKVREHVQSMLRTVGLPDPERVARSYPHELSGGMLQRAAIAVALSTNPKVLIADEPTTMLDVTLQAQILDLLRKLKEEFNLSMIFITHNLGVAAEVCDKILVMYAGVPFEEGSCEEVLLRPIHPYTKKLLECVPRAHRRVGRLRYIPGMLPDPKNLPRGCPFAPRCERATEPCNERLPKMVEVRSGHRVACHILAPGGEH
ncbi:MAG: ABC transporter ATP-binding protein [Desulfurococcales archaeon]|nr:ABC transporter ATP-binding protein [Desulfurococcales archaeon]